jgi:fructokinase
MTHHIGLDIGRTKIACGGYDAAFVLQHQQVIPTPGHYSDFLGSCVKLVQDAEAAMGCTGQASVGAGIMGMIRHKAGTVSAPNSIFHDTPLRHDLSAALGRPVRLANDANCAALAEAMDGAGRGHDRVVGLILGTGVGSGLIYRGEIIDGPNGLTGEIGHLPLPFRTADDGPVHPCGCKQAGCIEVSVNGAALERLYHFMTGTTLSPPEIAAAALQNDATACAVLDRYYEVVAKAMVAVIHSFDPDITTVSGGLNSLPGLYDAVPQRWGKYCYASQPATLLVPAQHGPMAGMRGAAMLGVNG